MAVKWAKLHLSSIKIMEWQLPGWVAASGVRGSEGVRKGIWVSAASETGLLVSPVIRIAAVSC